MRVTKTKAIDVTKPSLAPLDEFVEILSLAWSSGVLTHNGPLVQKLEVELCKKFNLSRLAAVTNGTIAMQLAIRALGVKGEILTTPFSWVATSSAIKWENCQPRFVDIDPDTFNLDPLKLEQEISRDTKAIMPVHVFSNPCDIKKIELIAKKHNLPVIYDAAHALGVEVNGCSILEFGNVSTTSFHATKIFNSGEGGACVSREKSIHEFIRRLRFFGHDESNNIVDEGLNGKMTEIHAALGLANLTSIDAVIEKRRRIYEVYYDALCDLDFLSFQKFPAESYNYSYMPIVFDSEERLIQVLKALNQKNIFPRRYFRPSLNTVKVLANYISCPVSERLASTVACLPSYDSLDLAEVSEIAKIIRGV